MRVVLLEKSLVMLSIIESNIGYFSISSSEIINKLMQNDEMKGLNFLSDCNALLKSGTDFPTAWSNALHKKSCFQPMRKKDIEILTDFSIIFGKTDTDGQIQNCKVYSSMLNRQLNEAKAEYNRYSSMFSVFGILSGVCIFIIFI